MCVAADFDLVRLGVGPVVLPRPDVVDLIGDQRGVSVAGESLIVSRHSDSPWTDSHSRSNASGLPLRAALILGHVDLQAISAVDSLVTRPLAVVARGTMPVIPVACRMYL